MDESERGSEAVPLAHQVKDLVKNVWLAIEKAGPDNSDLELTSQQHVVLSLIIRQPGISPTKLAAELGVTKGAVSQHLAALEKRRYVTRRRSADDGRKQVLELGELGQAYKDEQEGFEQFATEKFSVCLSESGLKQAADVLAKLRLTLASE